MARYWERLKTHPGVPIAVGFTILGAVGGIGHSENICYGMISGGMAGALATWPIVLWTARKNPLPGELINPGEQQ